MDIGFFHPERGYWQGIDVSKTPYTVIVEPEHEDIGEDGEEVVIPAVTRVTTQFDELLASYPEGTVEVPLKPAADHEWQDGEWVYVEPPPPPPPYSISRREFYQGLAAVQKITKNEALAAIKTGTIPAALQAMIDSMTDEDAAFTAECLLAGASDFERDNPLVMIFAIKEGMPEMEVDDFWRLCSEL